jgi:glucan phosphoethanolaminetransferase (alkaline phosphatase superfamily)
MTKTSYGLLLAFTFLILSPNLAAWKDISIDIIIVNLVFIILLLSFFKKIGIGLTLFLPTVLLAPFEVFYINIYGHQSDAHLLGVLGETNLNESTELLNGINTLKIIAALFPTLLFVMIIRKAFKENWQFPKRQRRWALATGASVIMLFAIPEAFSVSATGMSNTPDIMIMGNQGASLTSTRLENSYPAGLPFRIMSFINQRNGLREAQQVIADFKFNAKQIPETVERQIHILVIGETGRPDHWQLNGYPRQTTPRLAAMDDVTSLTNVTTGWAWTRMSVPVMITRKPANNTSAFFAERSLVSAFREAGFKTYWLSVQGPLGLHESSIALHAHEADETHFLNNADYRGSGSYDGALLAPLNKVLEKNEPKQLIVLHTLGSHYNYADRYPNNFNIFKPSLTGIQNANMYDRTQKELMNNSYDNSILYTDYFLAEVINRLKATDAQTTLLYTADHGENLFDGECDKSGHGHGTEYDFRVASLWWNSTKYTQAQPEKVAHIHEHKDSPLTTEHVFHTMLDVANIHYPEENMSSSVANASWKPRLRWTQGELFNGGLDFDTAPRNSVCKKLLPTTPIVIH